MTKVALHIPLISLSCKILLVILLLYPAKLELTLFLLIVPGLSACEVIVPLIELSFYVCN